MKFSIILMLTTFLCLVSFPTTTFGRFIVSWPKPISEGWPKPSEISMHDDNMFMNTNNLNVNNYEDSKVWTFWTCTYSNGSSPAISISPSTPSPTTPLTPSPTPPSPKTSPPPPTPPKKSPPPPTTPKKSPPPPKKSPPPPKKSPPPPTPSLPHPTPPKKSPPPPRPSFTPPTPPKKSPSPPHEHHHGHDHHENPLQHIDSCMRNMGPVTMCRVQMEISFYTKMFRVEDYCCNLLVNMKSECDDVVWGFFNDPFFVPLVRYTCHVAY
ncbi:unnamed protein product [Cochlearia groenlandica]